jgi:hypothetical protein
MDADAGVFARLDESGPCSAAARSCSACCSSGDRSRPLLSTLMRRYSRAVVEVVGLVAAVAVVVVLRARTAPRTRFMVVGVAVPRARPLEHTRSSMPLSATSRRTTPLLS